jgi:hypothetical protein
MSIIRAAAALAALLVFDAVLPAGVLTYTLTNRRFFPAADGTLIATTSNDLTTLTNDSLITAFTDPLTGNQFNATSAIAGSPFQLHDINSVTIAQATDSSCCSILSLVSTTVQDNHVLVTGGSGTAYMLPTFHVHGTIDDNNASLNLGIAVCAGNSSCVLSGAGQTATPGLLNIDTLFTPGISSSTQFTFGTPFSFFFFLEPSIQYLGLQATPGGTSTVDIRMDLVGIRISDANGNTIPGQIDAAILDIPVPEPAPFLLCGLALLAGVRLRRKRLV